MRFFGGIWCAGALMAPQVDPPVGAACAYGCGRIIGRFDQGVLLPHLVTPTERPPEPIEFGDSTVKTTGIRELQASYTVWHADCLLANLGIR